MRSERPAKTDAACSPSAEVPSSKSADVNAWSRAAADAGKENRTIARMGGGGVIERKVPGYKSEEWEQSRGSSERGEEINTEGRKEEGGQNHSKDA